MYNLLSCAYTPGIDKYSNTQLDYKAATNLHFKNLFMNTLALFCLSVY